MPSSTSSSDIPYREIPDQPWLPLLLIAAGAVIIALVFWEQLARSMHHEPGSYLGGFDAMWAEERRKLDQEDHDIRVVLTGSSRLLWAADLDILEDEFGHRPLQLALPGTSPALMVQDVVNNTDFDGLMLVGVTPGLFNWLGEGFFGGEALRRYRAESPSEWAGTQIDHVLNEHIGFLDEAFDLFKLLERYTALPVRPGSKNLMQEDWKLGNVFADRQTDMWAPVEIRGSFDNTQVTNFWTPGLAPERMRSPEEMAGMAEATIAFFAPLIETLHARGGDMVFIRMPSDGLYLQRDLESDHRNNLWLPMVAGFDAAVINSMDHPELSSELDIPEWSHVSRASQDLWSSRIVDHIRSVYRDKRGTDLDSLLNAAGTTP